MTPWIDMTTNDLWKNKAIAFLARSRKELWGKHNEDMLAWFFINGFKNRFILDMLLGWNKRPKERPAENWGFDKETSDSGLHGPNLFFPQGIVIPYVVDTHIEKLVIYNHEQTTGDPCHVVPGSSTKPVVFGKGGRYGAVVENILHGLLLFQEYPENLTVIVPDDKKGLSDLPAPDPGGCFQNVLYFPSPLKKEFHPPGEMEIILKAPITVKHDLTPSGMIGLVGETFFNA